MIVTRFAPSPTGLLHLGHAFAAITAAESSDDFLLRIEDLDAGRSRDEFVEAIYRDLKWLGLSWDEPVLRQSRRSEAYAAALARLTEMGVTYRCVCSRKEIAEEIARAGEAQHGPEGPLYPGTCRHLTEVPPEKPHVIRLNVAKAAALTGSLTFTEQGMIVAVDPLRFGDIVLARKDLPAAYHLAVVLDDAFQNVTLVTRGEDLLPATHPQRLLQALLGLPEPAYAHHRLVLDENGKKFSKRDHAVTLAALRDSGATPADVRAMLEM
ncbi:MAG: tRNA glutamyl-Q(34) synthetase GluQRS [Alphaproteobacteria bacterium]|nr:tRNA glutamyl-Q(34) synthetase GluQRS [Alphaproteobacteria bacterium]